MLWNSADYSDKYKSEDLNTNNIFFFLFAQKSLDQSVHEIFEICFRQDDKPNLGYTNNYIIPSDQYCELQILFFWWLLFANFIQLFNYQAQIRGGGI